MKLNDIFHYVFGDWSVIVIDPHAPPDKASEILAKKETAIQKKFSALFAGNVRLRRIFFHTLKTLAMSHRTAKSLFTILFKNDFVEPLTTTEEEKRYVFPDENQITTKFQQLNEHYKYFAKDGETESIKIFSLLFKATKLVADYVEQNNDEQNDLAYMHAYKMLVVLGFSPGNIFKYVNEYLKQHSSGEKPIHDSFLFDIPINDPPLRDKSGWQKFILTYGQKALSYFQEAQAIERLLNGKAPSTREEADKAASQIFYARMAEYPELAILAKKYHLSEKHFNRCLEIEKRRKKDDLLPSVSVNGKEVNKKGYHLVKLPIDDPRGYILGHITNCCQSIGGDSEQCVIDGMTLRNNGFYVLLKQKRETGEPQPFLEDKKINYRNFEIVGQGYAWHSMLGNITFDSWENLRNEDNELTVLMLKKWASKLSNFQVMRVTIGTGGKTPASLNEKVEAEQILEGVSYGDAATQALVYFNTEMQKLLVNDLLKLHTQKKSQIPIAEFQQLVNCITATEQVSWIAPLLFEDDGLLLWNYVSKTQDTHDEKIKNTLMILGIFAYLQRQGYTFEQIVALKIPLEHSESVLTSCIMLAQKNLLTKETLLCLITNANKIDRVLACIEILHRHGILNQDTIKIANRLAWHYYDDTKNFKKLVSDLVTYGMNSDDICLLLGGHQDVMGLSRILPYNLEENILWYKDVLCKVKQEVKKYLNDTIKLLTNDTSKTTFQSYIEKVDQAKSLAHLKLIVNIEIAQSHALYKQEINRNKPGFLRLFFHPSEEIDVDKQLESFNNIRFTR